MGGAVTHFDADRVGKRPLYLLIMVWYRQIRLLPLVTNLSPLVG